MLLKAIHWHVETEDQIISCCKKYICLAHICLGKLQHLCLGKLQHLCLGKLQHLCLGFAASLLRLKIAVRFDLLRSLLSPSYNMLTLLQLINYVYPGSVQLSLLRLKIAVRFNFIRSLFSPPYVSILLDLCLALHTC